MPAPPKVLVHGQPIILSKENVRMQLKGLDEGTLLYRECPNRDQFRKGLAAPGYPFLRITDIEAVRVPAPSGQRLFDITLHVRGLLDGPSRVINRKWRTSATGWDECTETRVQQLSTAALTKTTAQDGYDNMRLMELGEDEQLDDYWTIRDHVFRGFKDSDDKVLIRKIGANENITSPPDPVTNSLTGGWDDPRLANIALSRVTVEDPYTRTDAPPTDLIPGAVTPPDPPSIQTIVITASNLRSNWPHGWTYKNLNDEELYKGAGLHTGTDYYEYVWAAQF